MAVDGPYGRIDQLRSYCDAMVIPPGAAGITHPTLYLRWRGGNSADD
ncbi:hypothetical protein QEN44_22550 [Gordonia alkanivorans]|nr:hypothetical protein [Gordonia alkanivorans]